MEIKFGTDGWRAIIAQEYTTDNVARVAHATALWVKQLEKNPTVVIGHDCRFGGELFAETAAKVLCSLGVKVYIAKGMVSTPMISLGCFNLKATCGVVITASHNPASYNGFKLKSTYGGPTIPSDIAKVEALIPKTAIIPTQNIDYFVQQNLLEYIDLETMYYNHVEANFDMNSIKNSGKIFGYDAMYGAGQKIVKRLLPNNVVYLHCDENPSFYGQAPEPLHKNLLEFSALIQKSSDIDFGFANDGDADRIGCYDNEGNFIDSHNILLLLIHYLHKYKGMNGKVVVSFTVCEKIKKLCTHYNLPFQVTKVGFKYICEIMVNENVLVGGEESGGIAIAGHIPERDGVWNALVLMEFMAKTNKSITQLLQEVYDIVGAFHFERYDLHLTEELKNIIVNNCSNGTYTNFGKYNIERLEDLDGWKYHLDENSWVMIRASGTEPVLRVYAESSTKEKVFDILDTVKATLLG